MINHSDFKCSLCGGSGKKDCTICKISDCNILNGYCTCPCTKKKAVQVIDLKIPYGYEFDSSIDLNSFPFKMLNIPHKDKDNLSLFCVELPHKIGDTKVFRCEECSCDEDVIEAEKIFGDGWYKSDCQCQDSPDIEATVTDIKVINNQLHIEWSSDETI